MKNSMNMALNQSAWSVRCAFLPPLLAAIIGISGMHGAVAAPSNPTVVNGQVTFSQQGNVFTITNSPNAIINWSSFSVNAGEMVRFIQQNSSSSVLNRITGQDPSRIMGALQSNGRVFLINPNGIMFGAGSQVNVAGLVASTLAISNSDFLAGKNKFTAGDVTGAVSNMGAITTPSGGQVYLIAPDVSNSGIITSPKGDVVLAAGRSVQLADSTNPDMHVVVSAPSDHALNLGEVIAQGGKIGIYGALINQRGKLNANSAVVGENGQIILKASRTTLLEAGSVTSATGAGNGGEVQVLGTQVGLMGDAQVDVSGQTGGGTALIGGDYQGKNTAVMNAEQVFVGKDAIIKADAITNGNGGKVIVWGNQTAQAYGSIFARGGAQSGNGGFIETSGHHLDVAGIRVNAGAPKGKNGQWLLDPENIIVNDGGASLSDVAAFGNRPGETTQIDSQLLSNATADVILQATNNITFYYGVNNTHGVDLTAQAGNDIIVSSMVNFTGNITLAANHNGAGTATGTGRVRFDDGQATAGGIRTITDSLHPPVVPPVNPSPPPSADICTIAPNAALCQVLSPPTASEPVKPVQQASNEVIKVITTSTPKTDYDQVAFLDANKSNGNSSGGSGSSSVPASTDDKKAEDKKADTKEVASNDKSGSKNEPVKKMYCN